MKRTKNIIIFAVTLSIIVVLFSIILVSTFERKAVRVKIGYLPITLNLPLFVAMEKGYFIEEGLEVEAIEYTTADQLTNALLAGNIDITANTSISTFMTTVEESPLFAKIYMVSFHNPTNYLDALLVRRGSNIKQIKDLKGKKIGMFPGSTNVLYLSIALSNYLNPKTDIEMIQLPPQTHIEALASGQVDALYTLEPLVTLAVLKGVGEILIQGSNATYIVNPFPGGAWLVSTKFYKKHEVIAEKVINAIYRAVDFIKANEIEARKYLEKYTPIKGEVALKTHLGMWWKLEEVQKDKVQKLADVLYENKILKKKINTNDYYLR
jgi:NitT/TauT family transport system substrate-binding protein